MRVHSTTVSRRITVLESESRAKLFVRTPERLVTTPGGLMLLAHAERVEAEVLASERALLADPVVLAGPLRITAGDALVNQVVVPAMGELLAAHPELVIELRTDTAVVDLTRREADVALRFIRPREPAFVARRLGELPFAIFASEAYLRRRGTPRTVAAAAAHDFIGYQEALDHMPQVRWLHRTVRSPHYVLRASTLTTQLVACAEGLGLALLPVFSARREPRLKHLFPRQAGPARELWSVFHSDLRGNPRLTTFLTWLTDVLAVHIKP